MASSYAGLVWAAAVAAYSELPAHLRFDDDKESECSTDLGSERESSGDDHENEDECQSEDVPTFSAAETLVVFDWDDTLFPTRWLHRCGLVLEGNASALGQAQRAELRELAEAAERTLKEAALLGRVVIVTNAMEGWVQDSCARFMPSLLPVLTGLPIISARSAYEQSAASQERSARPDPSVWKVAVFESEVGALYDALLEGQRGNCISIGDSDYEHDALQQATQGRRGCLAKCLRFSKRPSLKELIRQHHLVGGSLEEIAAFGGDLDVDVSDS